MDASATPGSVRVAEVIGALSLATDLGMGQPLEFALASCVLAMRIGETLGLDDGELRGVYYQALLRYIGCNADTDILANLVGDEFAIRSVYATIDSAKLPEVVGMVARVIRQTQTTDSPLDLVRRLTRGLLSGSQITATFAGHCEVAQQLARQLAFSDEIVAALGQLYERWDGKGQPHGLKGEAISRSVQIVSLAQDALAIYRVGAIEAVVTMARERSGGAYSPALVEKFVPQAQRFFYDLDKSAVWERVMDLEPGKREHFTGEQLDVACCAMAHFVDIKSTYTLRHSLRVAELAANAARAYKLPEEDIVMLRRAGWLHDLGRTGVSASIWHKAEQLSAREWEQIRLHPYYTERILARPMLFARLGKLGSLHHERLDGSGYHRVIGSEALAPQARILAAADVFAALTEDRPHRPAYAPEAAAKELQKEAQIRRLDSDAVAAVLAAGQHTSPPARHLSLGLSAREIEVLRLVARGQTIKQMAHELVVASKTVDNHLQHIYTKIGVSTRAGATLFAMQHHLLED